MYYDKRKIGESEKNQIEMKNVIHDSNIAKEEIHFNINEIINYKNSNLRYSKEIKEKKIIFQTAPSIKNELNNSYLINKKKSKIDYKNDLKDGIDIKLQKKKVKVRTEIKIDNSNENQGEKETTREFGLDKKLNEESGVNSQNYDDGRFKTGRWQPDEHIRFIEAILRYGNQWNKVQKHVGSRSSTQARSHAQKFFVKIKRTNLLNFNIDLNRNSIKYLHEAANSMNGEEYLKTIKTLNKIAFEKKSSSGSGNLHNLFTGKKIEISPTNLLKNINDSNIDSNNNIKSFSNLDQSIITNTNYVSKNNFNQVLNLTEANNSLHVNKSNIPQTKFSNVKILSISENVIDNDSNIKSIYSKPINSDINRNINNNNNLHNSNISINTDKVEFNNMRNFSANSSYILKNNFRIRKRPRIDSLENIFFNNNIYDVSNGNSAVPKLKIEEEFYNAFHNSHHDFSIDDNLNINLNYNMNPFSLDNYLNYPCNNDNLQQKNTADKSNDTKEFHI